jgi:hypothetical protein
LRNHRVSFTEAAIVLKDGISITIFDPDHSNEEGRYMTVGTSTAGQPPVLLNRGSGTRPIDKTDLSFIPTIKCQAAKLRIGGLTYH